MLVSLQVTDIVIPLMIVLVLLIAIVTVWQSVERVDANERRVLTVRGEYRRLLGPRINIIPPFVSQTYSFDMRTQTLELPRQEIITRDNVPISADATVDIRVMDAKRAFLEVEDYRRAVSNLAQTTLRAVLGDMELDEILNKRQTIHAKIRAELDEPTDEWGIRVASVELGEIDSLVDIQQRIEEISQWESEAKHIQALANEPAAYEEALEMWRKIVIYYDELLTWARWRGREGLIDDLQKRQKAATHRRAKATIQKAISRVDAVTGEGDELFEQDEHRKAKQQYEKARETLETAQSLAREYEFEDAQRLVAELDDLAETVEHSEAKTRERVQKPARERAEKGADAQSTGEKRLAAEDYPSAIESYQEAVQAYEEAVDIASEVDEDLTETFEKQAASAESDLTAAAETAVERAFDWLPPDEFEVRQTVEHRAQQAESAFDTGDYVEAATAAADAIETSREGLQVRIADQESAASSLLEDEDYVAAIEAVDGATATARTLRDLATAEDDSAVNDVDATLEELAELRSDVITAATDAVEVLEEQAEDGMASADRAFNEGRYERAREEYERAAAAYTDAAQLAAELDLKPVDTLENGQSQAAERAGYSQLASVSAQIQDARESIADSPEAAIETFEEALSEIESLSFEQSSLQESRDELRVEARKGRLQARVEVGRERLNEAATLYDAGERYDARDAYRDAREYLETIRDDIADGSIEPPDLLDELLEACETNVEHISQELAGLTKIRASDGELRRVGQPGDSLPRVEDADAKLHDSVVDASRPGPSASVRGAAGPDASVPGTTDAPERTGAPVAERFELLGEGGTARVWRVRLEDGRDAALKVPRWSGTLEKRDIERFLTQAETWSRLDDHPNVVTVYDWGYDAEPWLLMEYVPDGSLDEHIGDLPPVQALSMMADIADALVYARGVAHLDVKPENVLLDGETPKLADWGLAKVAFAYDEIDTQLGMSPPYAAPEQVDRTLGNRDHRTDIYQLGVTTYELVTGRLPYPPDAPESLEARILAGDPPLPSALADVPPAVDDVILQAMAVEREERYEAPIQFRDSLLDVQRTLSQQ